MASKFQIPIAFKSDPRGIKEAEGALAGFGKKLAGIGVAVAGAFAIGAIFRFAKESVLAAERAQQFNDILVQVAKTTDTFGANLTSGTDRLLKFADAQELVIGVEAELIKETQAILLSFKAVGASAGEMGGQFDRATILAFDMATVLKKDVKSQAIALGKALEDPVKGVTALGKAGTTFTDQQKEQIKVLVDSNRKLEAQNLILNEVESQYGGAAEAGALWSVKLQLAFGQVQDALGASLTPAFQKFAAYFIENVVPPMTKFFEEDFPTMIEDFQPTLQKAIDFLGTVGQALKDFLDIDDDTSLLEGILDKFAELGSNPEFIGFLSNMETILKNMGPILFAVVGDVATFARNLAPLLLDALEDVLPSLGELASIIDDTAFFFGQLIDLFPKFEGETPGFIKQLELILNPMERVQETIRRTFDTLNDLRRAYEDFMNISRAAPTISYSGFGKRAVGGPVSADKSYLVGERGPEMFTPGAGGFITPNNRLGGGSSTNITINVTAGMGANGNQIGEEIIRQIKRYERASGPVFASA